MKGYKPLTDEIWLKLNYENQIKRKIRLDVMSKVRVSIPHQIKNQIELVLWSRQTCQRQNKKLARNR